MTLSQRKVVWIVILIVLALSGLVYVQTQLLLTAFEYKERAFDQNVMGALMSVCQKLAATEVYAIALTMDSLQLPPVPDSADAHWRIQVEAEHNEDLRIERSRLSELPDSARPALWVQDSTLTYCVPTPQHVRLSFRNPMTAHDSVLVDSFCTAGVFSLNLDPESMPAGRSFWKMETDSHTVMMQLQGRNSSWQLVENGQINDRTMLVGSVLNQLRAVEEIPISERIDPMELDSILSMTLREVGIDLPHAHGVIQEGSDSVLFAVAKQYEPQLRQSSFKTRLFPQDLLSRPANLAVYFPDRKSYLFAEMLPMVAPTALLMLIVVGCFAYTIRTIVVQRRLGNLLVDFINNMTHEFKTPISTVQLAAEAIGKDEVLANKTRLLHFNQMILNESRRMKNQADKILQMAVLEQGDYELKPELVDVHEIIRAAVHAVSLHVEARQGEITCELNAKDHKIQVDPVHFANIVNNVLDNANKYSPEQPRIRISTRNQNNRLVISVADNGIGMTPEDRKMVFNKFFRVPQGNRHDVKGFGLGLSYVKLMAHAHDGNVALSSELGKGTRVDLTFPLKNNQRTQPS